MVHDGCWMNLKDVKHWSGNDSASYVSGHHHSRRPALRRMLSPPTWKGRFILGQGIIAITLSYFIYKMMWLVLHLSLPPCVTEDNHVRFPSTFEFYKPIKKKKKKHLLKSKLYSRNLSFFSHHPKELNMFVMLFSHYIYCIYYLSLFKYTSREE